MEPLGTKSIEIHRDTQSRSGERRRALRQKIHAPAYASFNSSSNAVALDLSEIVDISESGVALRTASPLQVSRSLKLCLDLAESNACIYATGEVVWSDRFGRSGINLAGLPDHDRHRIREWLFFNALVACLQHDEALQEGTERKDQPSPTPAVVPFQQSQVETAPPEERASVGAVVDSVRRELEARPLPLDAALYLIAQRAHSFTRATGSAIAVSDGQALVCRATAGLHAPDLGARLQVGSGFSGECVRTGRLSYCSDSENDPRVDRDICRSLGIRSMAAAPLRLNGEVIGILEVFSSNPNAFGESDHAMLEGLAETVCEAVDRTVQRLPVHVEEQIGSAADESGIVSSLESQAEPHLPPLPRSQKILLTAVGVTILLAILSFFIPRNGMTAVPLAPPLKTSAPAQPQNVSAPSKSLPDVTSLDDLRKLAERGDPSAEFALGARYATGQEVNQDYAEAVRWFERAANHRHVIAQATLGAYYWTGRGVPKDLEKAYFWSILARAGGDEASKYRVAVLTSLMTRTQIAAAQQQADDWLKQHQSTAKN